MSPTWSCKLQWVLKHNECMSPFMGSLTVSQVGPIKPNKQLQPQLPAVPVAVPPLRQLTVSRKGQAGSSGNTQSKAV